MLKGRPEVWRGNYVIAIACSERGKSFSTSFTPRRCERYEKDDLDFNDISSKPSRNNFYQLKLYSSIRSNKYLNSSHTYHRLQTEFTRSLNKKKAHRMKNTSLFSTVFPSWIFKAGNCLEKHMDSARLPYPNKSS